MKLRMKVNGHEFECEGEFAEVQRRYVEWHQMLRAAQPEWPIFPPMYAEQEWMEAKRS